MDKYDSFQALKKSETDFNIELHDRGSNITIIAPHGGKIEPHTSEIARTVAGQNYNCFCFNGSKKKGNRDLHITSHNYDEEKALDIVCRSNTVVAIHGCTEQTPMIYLGGLDIAMKQKLAENLKKRSIPCCMSSPPSPFSGTNRNNICNRGLTGKGIQLEISRPLRDSPSAWQEIAHAVHETINGHAVQRTGKPIPL